MPKIATSSDKANITFVFTKKGNTPYVFIDNPSDASDYSGEIYPSGFNILKDHLVTIVDYIDHDLFFHNDKRNVCSFDENKLQHGKICRRKEARRHCDKD